MRRKLPAYSLIFVVSLCFFTFLFHTFAGAQSLSVRPTPTHTPSSGSAGSGPTATPSPTATPTPTLTPTPIPPTATPEPTSTPTPITTIVTSGDLETLFSRFADEYHIDKELLKRIAKCESGFNPNAVNGPYLGMFQFVEGTWIAVRSRMGLDPTGDVRRNAEESIRTAAYMISNGQQNAWANCL